jgi:hypothetical protein
VDAVIWETGIRVSGRDVAGTGDGSTPALRDPFSAPAAPIPGFPRRSRQAGSPTRGGVVGSNQSVSIPLLHIQLIYSR